MLAKHSGVSLAARSQNLLRSPWFAAIMVAKPAVRSDTWLRVTRFIIRIRSEFRSAYLGIIIDFSLYSLSLYLSLPL